MASIWISYRRQDSEAITGRIFDRLIAHFGKDAVFRDIDNIPAGVDFRQHIGDTLGKAGVVIAIVGPQWVGPRDGATLRIEQSNDPVRVEVEIALRRRLALLPVTIGDAKMPSAEQLPPSLMDFSFRNAVKIDPGVDFDYHMERLIRSVEALLAEKGKSAGRSSTGEKKAATGVIDVPAGGRKSGGTTAVRSPQTVARERPAAAPADGGRRSADAGISRAAVMDLAKTWFPATRRARITWIAAAGLAALVLTVVIAGSAVRLWSGSDEWQSAATLTGHADRVSAVAFAANGKRIASGSLDKSVKVWDPEATQAVLTLAGRSGAVSSVAFTPDGKQVLSGSLDGSIADWDAGSGQALRVFRHDASGAWEKPNPAVWAIAMSPDGRRIASGCADGVVRIWDAANGQDPIRMLNGHGDAVTWVAFLHDAGTLVSASKDGTVRVWDVAAGRSRRTLSAQPPAAISAGGKYLAAVVGNSAIAVWDTASFSLLHTIPGEGAPFDSLALSPDGQRLAAGGRDGSLHVWDVQSGQILATLRKHVGSLDALAFSPDGRHLVSGGDDRTVHLWTD